MCQLGKINGFFVECASCCNLQSCDAELQSVFHCPPTPSCSGLAEASSDATFGRAVCLLLLNKANYLILSVLGPARHLFAHSDPYVQGTLQEVRWITFCPVLLKMCLLYVPSLHICLFAFGKGLERDGNSWLERNWDQGTHLSWHCINAGSWAMLQGRLLG